jgi:ribosomal protein S18 acetylase RimI-like enzyme
MNVPINAKRLRATLPDVVERVRKGTRFTVIYRSCASTIASPGESASTKSSAACCAASGPEMVVVRRAEVADAPGIAKVGVRSWQAVYRGLMPDAFLDRLDADQGAQSWSKTITSPDNDVTVAVDGLRGVLGFCLLIRSRDADASPTTGELAAIYVDPAVWRTGIGAALAAELFKAAAARGFDTLTLWVLEDNTGARRFYERLGFQHDGTMRLENRWGDFAVREVRYRSRVAL